MTYLARKCFKLRADADGRFLAKEELVIGDPPLPHGENTSDDEASESLNN